MRPARRLNKGVGQRRGTPRQPIDAQPDQCQDSPVSRSSVTTGGRRTSAPQAASIWRFVAHLELAIALPLLLVRAMEALLSFPDTWLIALTADMIVLIVLTLTPLCVGQAHEARRLEALSELQEDDDRILYPSGQDELRFTKNLQWNLLYYVLVVFGALFALSSAVDHADPTVRSRAAVVLYGLTCAAFAYGLYLIVELHLKLRNYRIQLNKSRFARPNYVTQGNFDAQTQQRDRANDIRFWRDARFSVVAFFSLLVGYLAATLRIWSTLRNLAVVVLLRLLF